jgi:hypothetical protein
MSVRKLVFLLAALVLVASFVNVVMAQEDGAEDAAAEGADEAAAAAGRVGEEDEGDQVEADGIYTSAFFPSHPDQKFPAGQVVESLIGFDNQNPSDDFRVEFIRASLTAPHDTRQFVQNFTGATDNSTVQHGSEGSFSYKFRPDVNLEPRDYGIVIQVYYMNNENETFLSTVFNSTVTITDPVNSFDARTLFAYISILAIFGLVGFAGYKRTVATRARTARRQQPLATGTDGIEWDFVSKEHQQFLRKREAKAATATSPKSQSPKSKGK